MSKPKYTETDLRDWQVFEGIRESGAYNMYDPRAREATGLSEERYYFVMKNFSELKAEAEKEI